MERLNTNWSERQVYLAFIAFVLFGNYLLIENQVETG